MDHAFIIRMTIFMHKQKGTWEAENEIRNVHTFSCIQQILRFEIAMRDVHIVNMFDRNADFPNDSSSFCSNKNKESGSHLMKFEL